MKQWAVCCVVIFVMAIGVLPAGAQVPTLFENFEGKTLDPGKWFGKEAADPGVVVLEWARQLKTEPTYQYRGLYLLDRAHANTASDTGTSTGSNRLYFTDGSNIRTIQATVQVKKLQNTTCLTNTEALTQGRLRIGGLFFNTDVPTPGSSLNDVYAYIAVGRRSDSTEPANVLSIYGSVFLCTDDPCMTTTPIGGVDVGTVKVNQKVKLRITWDPDNDQFIFQKGKGEEFLVSYTGYSDTNPPGTPNGGNKRLEVQNVLANCTDDSRPWGQIDAFFDNIYLDQPPVPGL